MPIYTGTTQKYVELVDGYPGDELTVGVRATGCSGTPCDAANPEGDD